MKVRQEGFTFYWINPETGKLVKTTAGNIQQADQRTMELWARDAIKQMIAKDHPNETIEWVTADGE